MSDGVTCTGFEPQNYLKDRCKKCFRLKSKHDELNNNLSTTSSGTQTNSQNGRPRRPISVSSAIGPPEITASNVATTILAKKEKRRSWKEKTNPDEGPDNDCKFFFWFKVDIKTRALFINAARRCIFGNFLTFLFSSRYIGYNLCCVIQISKF